MCKNILKNSVNPFTYAPLYTNINNVRNGKHDFYKEFKK